MICATLDENEKSFAVIEKDPEEIQAISNAGYYGIKGDASEDDILQKAGIDSAKGLIAVVRHRCG